MSETMKTEWLMVSVSFAIGGLMGFTLSSSISARRAGVQRPSLGGLEQASIAPTLSLQRAGAVKAGIGHYALNPETGEVEFVYGCTRECCKEEK